MFILCSETVKECSILSNVDVEGITRSNRGPCPAEILKEVVVAWIHYTPKKSQFSVARSSQHFPPV